MLIGVAALVWLTVREPAAFVEVADEPDIETVRETTTV